MSKDDRHSVPRKARIPSVFTLRVQISFHCDLDVLVLGDSITWFSFGSSLVVLPLLTSRSRFRSQVLNVQWELCTPAPHKHFSLDQIAEFTEYWHREPSCHFVHGFVKL